MRTWWARVRSVLSMRTWWTAVLSARRTIWWAIRWTGMRSMLSMRTVWWTRVRSMLSVRTWWARRRRSMLSVRTIGWTIRGTPWVMLSVVLSVRTIVVVMISMMVLPVVGRRAINTIFITINGLHEGSSEERGVASSMMVGRANQPHEKEQTQRNTAEYYNLLEAGRAWTLRDVLPNGNVGNIWA
jgi:hypothetical protein